MQTDLYKQAMAYKNLEVKAPLTMRVLCNAGCLTIRCMVLFMDFSWAIERIYGCKLELIHQSTYDTDIVEAQVLEQGVQLVALEGRSRQVWENMWSNSCLNLYLPSSVVHVLWSMLG
ncbi:hypothetical protein Bca4012_026716 [Brassica carinata]